MTIPGRKARPEDAPAITALVHATYAPWVDVIGKTPGPMLTDYAQMIADHFVTVREDDAGLREVSVLIRQDDAVLIDNIAVRADLQGRGIGRMMIESAEINARMYGFPRTRLYVHEKMERNIAFYQRLGYVITKRVTEQGLNRVYMEKELEPWPSGARPMP